MYLYISLVIISVERNLLYWMVSNFKNTLNLIKTFWTMFFSNNTIIDLESYLKSLILHCKNIYYIVRLYYINGHMYFCVTALYYSQRYELSKVWNFRMVWKKCEGIHIFLLNSFLTEVIFFNKIASWKDICKKQSFKNEKYKFFEWKFQI